MQLLIYTETYLLPIITTLDRHTLAILFFSYKLLMYVILISRRTYVHTTVAGGFFHTEATHEQYGMYRWNLYILDTPPLTHETKVREA